MPVLHAFHCLAPGRPEIRAIAVQSSMLRRLLLVFVLVLCCGCGGTATTNPLQERAKAFLQRSIPNGNTHAPDAFSELFIKTYAADGKIEPDAEIGELLQTCVTEAESAADSKSGDEAAYFRERYEILRAILAETRQ